MKVTVPTLVVLALALAACGQTTIPVDVTAPTMNFTSSAKGSTLTVTPTATDEVGVAYVRLFIGSKEVAESTPTSPIMTVSNVQGSDEFTLKASDAAGNETRLLVPNIVVDPQDVYVDSTLKSAKPDGSNANPFTTLKDGYAAVNAGGVLRLAAGQYTGVNIDSTKWLTIVGPNAGILGSSARLPEAVVNGNNISIGASGTTLRGLKFVIPPVDEANAFFIGANNVIVEDSVFEGPGKPADSTWSTVTGSTLTVFGKVYRGMEILGNFTNIVIKDNLFKGLRQPAFVASSYVTITGNHVDGSRGWVFTETKPVQIAANVFSNTEAADFALTMLNPCLSPEYRGIVAGALSLANNNAIVSDQRTPECKP